MKRGPVVKKQTKACSTFYINRKKKIPEKFLPLHNTTYQKRDFFATRPTRIGIYASSLKKGLALQRKSIYLFLFWELRGHSPNFHIQVSVSDLHILRIGPHISCSRIGRSMGGIYKSPTDI